MRDRGAAGGLRVVVGQCEGDDRVVGVVGVGERARGLLARVELVEQAEERTGAVPVIEVPNTEIRWAWAVE